MVHPLLKQLYATVGASCTMLSIGYVVGVMSVMLPALRAPDSSIHLNLEEESWLPAILYLMMFPAQFVCGVLTSRFGRKIFVILALVPTLVGFLLLHFATNYAMLFAGSLLIGLVAGGNAICHMMLAEMLSPDYRGLFLNAKTSFSTVGVVLSHSLGNYCHWRTMALYGTLIPISGILITSTVPESHAWPASQGRFKESRSAFFWIRGNNEEDELRQLIEKQKKEIASKQIEKQKKKPWWVRFRLFVSDRGFLKAVAITIASVVLVEASGLQIFTLFAIDFITKIVGTDSNPFFYAMILDTIQIISAVVSCFTLHFFSRRRLLFGTGVPANILLIFFSIFVYLTSIGVIPKDWSWFAIAIFGACSFLEGIGIVPVSFTFMGEIIPLSHRGEGVAINSFVFMSLMFLVAKLAPSMVLELGVHGVFLIHAGIMTACLVYLYIFVPETDRKTLHTIEEEMNGETNPEELQNFIRKEKTQDVVCEARRNKAPVTIIFN